MIRGGGRSPKQIVLPHAVKKDHAASSNLCFSSKYSHLAILSKDRRRNCSSRKLCSRWLLRLLFFAPLIVIVFTLGANLMQSTSQKLGRQYGTMQHTIINITANESNGPHYAVSTNVANARLPTPAAVTTDTSADKWVWYNGDLNQYYNDLEKDIQRDPNDINDYAVHRWLGPNKSTTTHYELIHEAIMQHYYEDNNMETRKTSLKVLDAGCGLGAALMWLEERQPSWRLSGLTLSEAQAAFVQSKLPRHNFSVAVASFDDLKDDESYHAIYSIEAMIHSTNLSRTVCSWALHLENNGLIVVIDDFLVFDADRSKESVEWFRKSWLANSLVTVAELISLLTTKEIGLEMVQARDLTIEYNIVQLNYRNQVPPKIAPFANHKHQGWMGSKLRQQLTVEGVLTYQMLVFQKKKNPL